MKFTTLEKDEYTSFVARNFSHYTQTESLYNYRNSVQKDALLVGVKDDFGNVMAACLLTEGRAMKFFKYFYTERGPVMDFKNVSLVHFFFKELAVYLRSLNGLFVRVDPYVVENIHNHDGEIIESLDNRALFHTLEQLGYQHQGFPIGYSTISQIRWLSILDLKGLSGNQLLKNMEYKTRRNIKKTEEMGVQVRDLDISETPIFYELLQMAEDKHGFTFRDEAYFKKMLKIYGDHAFLKLAYIDLDEYIANIQIDLDKEIKIRTEIQNTLKESPNSKKNKSKLEQSEKRILTLEKKIDDARQLKASDGRILNLAAALYIYNNHEVYYLSSGSNTKYNIFMGAYKLQWEMIQFAKAHNIDRYNFYGITGDFTPEAEDAGVIRFKKGFNAEVYELVGDFIKPLHPVLYKMYQYRNKN